MKCLVWLQFAVLALAVSAQEGEKCPDSCKCGEENIGPFVATCSTLDPNQRFGYKIARLILKDIPQTEDLVLTNSLFQTVGLKHVSNVHIINSTFKTIEPRAFDNLKKLRYFTVENSQISLYPDMFNTTDLMTLTLKESHIDIKSAKYLFQIPTLTELIISGCHLTNLPVSPFSELPYLQFISLASNKIKRLDGNTFSTLEDLREVDLSDNLIGELGPEVFGKNIRMDILNLHKNPLFSLAGVAIPSLTDLDVSLCKFSEISSETFPGFTDLIRLNLSGNAIQQIDNIVFSTMDNLQYLDLSSNVLKGPLASDLFLHNHELETLTLAHNPLGSLPRELFYKLNDLYRLDLSHCGLDGLQRDQFKDLSKLVTLNLAGNYIEEVQPSALNEFIIDLDLSSNQIPAMELIRFPANSRIKKLSLAKNPLITVELDALVSLPRLEKLNLRGCGLTSLWESQTSCIGDLCPMVLKNLRVLVISDNNIQSISTEQLDSLPNLGYLDLLNNPLVCDSVFNASIQWLKDHSVEPLHYSDQLFIPNNAMTNPESENVVMPRWSAVKETICGPRDIEEVEPHGSSVSTDDSMEGLPDVVVTIEGVTNCADVDESDCSVQQEAITDRGQNYLWPILIASISAIAVLLSMIILVAFGLRWARQKNSYGAAIIKNHLNSPRLKRERSSIYQQLYEDPNCPTTPVMITKNDNQTQYNFPEHTTDENKKGYISYLSKDYHDSKPIPESV